MKSFHIVTCPSPSFSPTLIFNHMAQKFDHLAFCFPDIDQVKMIYQSGSFILIENFTFTITDEDGSRQFGFCRRFDYLGSAYCFCVVSDFPQFEFYYTLMENMQYLLDSYDDLSIFPRVLDYFNGFGLPKQGTALYIQLAAEVEAVEFPNPDYGLSKSPFGNVDFTRLISNLSISHIIALFASFFFERRIIFSSSQLDKLSECIYGALSMLYPFTWHLVLIPLLPKSMLSFAMAPMPFIIGVHSTMMDEVRSLPLEQVVFVNLDEDSFQGNVDDSLSLPPSISSLRFVLESEKFNYRKTGRLNNGKIYKAFQQFYVDSVGYYQFFLKEDDFEAEAFIKSSGEKKKFLTEFCQTLMFSQFIEERKTRLQNGQDLLSLTEVDQKCYHIFRTSDRPEIPSDTADEEYDDLFSFKGIKKRMMNVIKKEEKDEPLIDFSSFASFATLPAKSDKIPREKEEVAPIQIQESSELMPEVLESSSDDLLINLPSKPSSIQYQSTNPFLPVLPTQPSSVGNHFIDPFQPAQLTSDDVMNMFQQQQNPSPPAQKNNPFGPPIFKSNNPFL